MSNKFTDSYNKIFKDKNKIMVVFAHPDDLECMCGGLIARLIKDGKQVRSLKMTNGDKGSRENKISADELINARQKEDLSSMELLGVLQENSVYLGFEDGHIENSVETIEKLAYQIRKFKPDLIVTHNPEVVIVKHFSGDNWVNHRDHRNTAKSTVDAAYPYSRDLLFFPHHFEEDDVESHKALEFLFVDSYMHPQEVFIDTTEFKQTKIEALAKHSSQFDLESAKNLLNFMVYENEGKQYESFRHVVID